MKAGAIVVVALLAAGASPGGAGATQQVGEQFPNQIGPQNERIRRLPGGQVLLWASGDPRSDEAEWYDFTGAPIAADELQYGIGKDRIRAIDDPVFVEPDDPRLLTIPPSPYRNEPAPSADDIMVIGYMQDGEPRAYPTALLDRHEIVNDEFKGKPVAVGW